MYLYMWYAHIYKIRHSTDWSKYYIIYRHIFICSYTWHTANWRQVSCTCIPVCGIYMYVFIHVTCDRLEANMHIRICGICMFVYIYIFMHVTCDKLEASIMYPHSCVRHLHVCIHTCNMWPFKRFPVCGIYMYVFIHVTCDRIEASMGWLRLVGSLKL